MKLLYPTSKTILQQLLLTVLVSLPILTQAQQLTKYIDPFIGTGAHGHTYPGTTVPFGMVQISPDNGTQRWDRCSGYQFDEIKFKLAGSKAFLIRAKNAGKGRPYIQSVQLNNHPYNKAYIQHATMMDGGVLNLQ